MNTNLVISIDEVARSRLAKVSVGATLVEAARLLSGTHISLVVVCDPAGVMVGVVTKTDIVQQIGHLQASACTTKAADLMTRDVAYCRPTDRLPDVLAMMGWRGYVHIPVVDEGFQPIGVVNARDALRALLAQGEYEGSLLRDYVMGIGYR